MSHVVENFPACMSLFALNLTRLTHRTLKFLFKQETIANSDEKVIDKELISEHSELK